MTAKLTAKRMATRRLIAFTIILEMGKARRSELRPVYFCPDVSFDFLPVSDLFAS